MAGGEIKRPDLGNLNPIYEREPNKPDVREMKEVECLCAGREAKDVCFYFDCGWSLLSHGLAKDGEEIWVT